jgi:hypothetical protein
LRRKENVNGIAYVSWLASQLLKTNWPYDHAVHSFNAEYASLYLMRNSRYFRDLFFHTVSLIMRFKTQFD